MQPYRKEERTREDETILSGHPAKDGLAVDRSRGGWEETGELKNE